MKTYFIVCGVMFLTSMLQTCAKAQEFKKEHPWAKFKKKTFIQTLVSCIHLVIYFTCPLFNVLCFLAINFFIDDDKWNEVFFENMEKD